MSTPPNYIADFLRLSHELQYLKDKQRACRQQLRAVEPEVNSWLRNVPNNELIVESDDGRSNREKLRFFFDNRKEYLTQNSLTQYLMVFFTQLFGDKSSGDISQLSQQAANFVWNQRPIKKRAPLVVLRPFSHRSNKRKFGQMITTEQ